MKMTFTKSQYEMPDGKYLAKFTGVTMKEDKPGDKPRLGQDGKPLPPAMTWDFVVVEGDQAGKKADKLTGRVPGPKNGCGKMLAGITDTILKDGMEIDLEQFVGKIYRITVEENRVLDNPAPVRVYDSATINAANGVTPPPAKKAPPPPPRKGPSGDPMVPTEPADDSKWHVSIGDDWKEMTGAEVKKYITENKVAVDELWVTKDGEAVPKTADTFGFVYLPF